MSKIVQLQECTSVTDANWICHHSNGLNARLTQKPDASSFLNCAKADVQNVETNAQARFPKKLSVHFNTFRHATGFLAAWVVYPSPSLNSWRDTVVTT